MIGRVRSMFELPYECDAENSIKGNHLINIYDYQGIEKVSSVNEC